MQERTLDSDSTVPIVRRRRLGPLIVGVVFGGVAGLLVAVVFGVWLFRDPLPRLTPERLGAAVKLWRENGPASYDLDLTLSGGQNGLIHIEVRDGEVAAMTRNGRTPGQRRTWDYWSVENQLDALGQELESAQNPQRAFGVSSESSVMLRAEFDPQYGYPRIYHRIVLGQSSELRWEVTSFVPIESPTSQ